MFAGWPPPRPPSFNVPTGVAGYQTEPFSDLQLVALNRMYRERLETLQAVDEGIAATIDSLAAWGQLDNTLVIFTSDNGYAVGEHALEGKNYPYAESYRVPLMIRGPGVVAEVSDELVGHLDLAPTIADFAGVPSASFVDGRSLRPILEGAGPPWRTAILIEHWRAPANQSVLRANKIYTEWQGGQKAYYDLAADPYQTRNLWGVVSPGSIKKFLLPLKTCVAAGCRAADMGVW
jgi:arylsulfatase A-like enzyme